MTYRVNILYLRDMIGAQLPWAYLLSSILILYGQFQRSEKARAMNDQFELCARID